MFELDTGSRNGREDTNFKTTEKKESDFWNGVVRTSQIDSP